MAYYWASRIKREGKYSRSEGEIKYIKPVDLLKRLKDKTVLVIDVRGDDYEGGHIPGCRNIPCGQFKPKVDALVKEMIKTKKLVVFHCMYSMTRGPLCARLFASKVGKDEDLEIRILENGFRGWFEGGYPVEDENAVIFKETAKEMAECFPEDEKVYQARQAELNRERSDAQAKTAKQGDRVFTKQGSEAWSVVENYEDVASGSDKERKTQSDDEEEVEGPGEVARRLLRQASLDERKVSPEDPGKKISE